MFYILVFWLLFLRGYNKEIYKPQFSTRDMAIIQDIKSIRNDFAYVVAPFDVGKAELEKAGYEIISLEQNVQLRIQEGKDADISRNGNWVREGVLYVPKKGIFLTKKSPIMANAEEAISCHRNGKDFYLTDAQVEEALSDSVVILGDSIPANRFAENPVTVYAFGKTAEAYGQFLKEAGINEMPVWLANLQDKLFARQMWLHGLGVIGRSELGGCWGLGYLGCNLGVLGVRESAEGTAKNSEAYTPKQILKSLEELGFSGIKEGLLKKT